MYHTFCRLCSGASKNFPRTNCTIFLPLVCVISPCTQIWKLIYNIKISHYNNAYGFQHT